MHWKTKKKKKKIPMTCFFFIVVFPLLQWSETELAYSEVCLYMESKKIPKKHYQKTNDSGVKNYL